MTLAIAISTFLGLLAAMVLSSLWQSLRLGIAAWFDIRAELRAMDRPARAAALPLRQPQAAFALLAV